MRWIAPTSKDTATATLEKRLWDAADEMRANSGHTAAQYSQPVLGLVFLRFADAKFAARRAALERAATGRRGSRVDDAASYHAEGVLYLPAEARFGQLLDYPEGGRSGKSLGQALDDAMRAIEEANPQLSGVLPKTYQTFNARTLKELLKTFSTISADLEGDSFGKIYEYFLGEFAMAEGQGGGEFYTPTSIVRLIVEILGPFSGRVLDGVPHLFAYNALLIASNGTESQVGSLTADWDRFFHWKRIESEDEPRRVSLEVLLRGTCDKARLLDLVRNFSLFSEHKTGLAKVLSQNHQFLGVNNAIRVTLEARAAGHGRAGVFWQTQGAGIRHGGEINSYYDDPHNLVGRFDFVVANPPFNVDKVDKDRLKDAAGKGRRFPFGLPKSDNANYLWIQLFYSALNASGRAGFVMANSASDARSSELEIRKQLIESPAVDVVVSVGSNMFYTVTLPCTLWFLDRGKPKDRRDKVLFLDLRNIYRQIDRAHRDWTPGQIGFVANVVRLYRGEDVDLTYGGDEAGEKLREVFGKKTKYADVPGFCKIATLKEIEAQGWSLNPGRYVGVAPGEDVSDEDFKEQFGALNAEFETLTAEAKKLEKVIATNAAEILGG